ncbi:mitochondrial 37S ribosomal protein bS18m RSM18 ASCRUDRAFT_116416 [Ascoidea rubescens DSM 1968]|uniref:Small ribosomal subunit protein bS18m n=1 Tax=Ascoidea rubescens DSM 1968 TaxID=1344418 RepID=A0A1D2VAZ2_9ASCO|nr:hypothetical protein ASCRUDRAFT_116416 [Ascoidea rubescens DSM 1968]ODV58771.1 hypothetical protein ASCRUDRAFT_116416 [Ascoidea rubescens DSM 1968]
MINTALSQELEISKRKKDLGRIDANFHADFREKTVYDPFDFSMAKLKLTRKFQKRSMQSEEIPKEHRNYRSVKKQKDKFIRYQIDPSKLVVFPTILTEYLSPTGQINHLDSCVGLSAKSHKRLVKAIKRARNLGILSPIARDLYFKQLN